MSNIENQNLISIIMNCYNGEQFLRKSIESVLSQTYKNWELIFWDNQSIDKSAEIFKSYADKRFKYFYSEEHTSLYKARNLAIERSNGDFIAFIDTDDIWEKNKLKLQMTCFNNIKTGVVFSNYWILKNNDKKKLYTNKKLPSGNIYKELINNYTVGILTVLLKKEIYLNLTKKFDDRFSIIGDYDLFLRLSKVCSFDSIQEPLATYRLHGKNLSNINKEKEIEECDTWLKENKSNLSNEEIENLQKKFDNRKFINYKIDGKYKDCINLFLKSKKNLLNIKNLVLFLTPSIILKKILWYHLDHNDVK